MANPNDPNVPPAPNYPYDNTLEKARDEYIEKLNAMTPKPDTPSPAGDEPERCDRCGWPLKERVEDGCVRDNCSQRPLQPLRTIYSAAEYYSMRKRRNELRAENARLREDVTKWCRADIRDRSELSAANAELARLRGLLEMAAEAFAFSDGDNFCEWCSTGWAHGEPEEHEPDCMVLTIRAALATNTTQGGSDDATGGDDGKA